MQSVGRIVCWLLPLFLLAMPVPAGQKRFPTPEFHAFHQAIQPLLKLEAKETGRLRRGVPDLDRLRKQVLKAKWPPVPKDRETEIKELRSFFDAAMDELVRIAKQSDDEELRRALDAVNIEFVDLVEALNALPGHSPAK